MLLLWGEKDFVFDRHVLSEWTRRFPAARVEVFPEAGHLILEDARDESLALIRGFLEEESGLSREDEGVGVNIASHLPAMARRQPDKPCGDALVW